MRTTADPNRIHWEAAARDEHTDWAGLTTEPHGIDQEWVDEPAGLWLRPHGPAAGCAVLAIHGGGFVSGSILTHRRMFGHLARALRDVLGLPAAEVADMLQMSIPAVKGRLQRARSRLADAALVPEDVVEPTDRAARRLLDAYVQAFETADVDVLTAALRADATLELLPSGAWYAGKRACSRVLAGAVGEPAAWRMERTLANGQPAVVAYLHDQPFGIAVIDARRDGIAGITVFGDPALVSRFTDRRAITPFGP